MNASITSRPIAPQDDLFLLHLYTVGREEEFKLLPWSPAEKAAFMQMQFQAQRADYQRRFPHADYNLILADNEPVGYLYVARSSHEIRALDIAIAPEQRNRGIGTAVLHQLIAEAEASKLPLSYMVLRFNEDALRLYLRLGFQVAGEHGNHYLLQWQAAR